MGHVIDTAPLLMIVLLSKQIITISKLNFEIPLV